MSIAYDKVLLIVLGIIVLTASIYIYSHYISPQSTNCEICRNSLVNWCTHCNITSYPSDVNIPSDLCKCTSECNLISCSGTPSCNDLKETCNPFVTHL
ncbi:MAG: hypothetical protein QXP77_02340 [Candidatus Aenigmatarchaeota archaeon]